MFICDKNFGECLEDALLRTYEEYRACRPQSGRRLLSMLEKLVADAQVCAVELDNYDFVELDK